VALKQIRFVIQHRKGDTPNTHSGTMSPKGDDNYRTLFKCYFVVVYLIYYHKFDML